MADVTNIEPLHRDEEAFLRALGRVMSLLPRTVDADMLEDHPISSTEYMVTDSGWTQPTRAWPINPASARRHVLSRLDGRDIAAAAKVLERIAPS
ncbi:hypothetical protein [Streptomyces sp. NPDC005385]|uniref:hypothetical protein n=1 Tax=Streptomyces sp. NPDC005385 TaxID=3157039 RepID=UPI0033AC3B48